MSRLPDIVCRGVREHNLTGFDVVVPGQRLVALTGVSGSGKSSLAFDVIAREGRRRYLETLSAFARRRVGAERPPRVASVRGLGATIALEQRDVVRSPRVSVGTLSGIAPALRSIWATAGTLHCPSCDRPVSEASLEETLASALELGDGSRVHVLAPLWRKRRGDVGALLDQLREQGFVRARLDGRMLRLDEPFAGVARHQKHDVEVVVDRLRLDASRVGRLREAIERAIDRSEGLVTLLREDDTVRTFGTRRACVDCGIALPRPEPRWFSPNDPLGACETCRGLGRVEDETCIDCGGTRLQPSARAVRLVGARYPELASWPLSEVARWVSEARQQIPGDAILTELWNRAEEGIDCLLSLALGYVSLDRSTDTLSHGEIQRVRLAAQLGAELQGLTYVLDEPTAGLHAVDRGRLRSRLEQIRDRGNTVLLVEHDLELIRAADWVIDLGPGAGPEGGRLVATGAPAEIESVAASLTGRALCELREPPAAKELPPSESRLRIVGAREHNLKSIDVEIPLGRMVAVTGVSGSGKSTLIEDVLFRALANELQGAKHRPGLHDRIEGLGALERVELVTARALGRSPRSNAATVTRAFDDIRQLFAQLPEARTRGWTARRFSLNVPGGRCEACRGTGVRRLRFDPLPPSEVVCQECDGRRYRRDTLDLRFKNHTIAGVLELTASEARQLFENHPRLHRALSALERVGLGYITLGQPVPELSGGEAQRLKLAAEMRRRRTGATLFLLDEPTRGLHAADIDRLWECWRELVARGDSVVLVEHHLSVIGRCDWVIDLGPGAGPEGGRIVATGTPAEVSKSERSLTGQALAQRVAVREEAGPPEAEPARALRVEAASTWNLRSIDCEIEHDRLTVLRGPIGSGKTALARATIEAEARRLFLTTSAGNALIQLDSLERAPVRRVEGLRPVIAIDDEPSAREGSQTVSVASGIDRPLRELFAQAGTLHCPICDRAVAGRSAVTAADEVLADGTMAGARALILAPVWWPASGRRYGIEGADETGALEEWCRKSGLVRVQIGEEIHRIDREPLPTPLAGDTFLVIDRVQLTSQRRARLREALETAYELASGVAVVESDERRLVFSREVGCPEHGFWPPTRLEPRWFSARNRSGACPACGGSGEAGGGVMCPECEGSGLNAIARSVRLAGRSFAEWSALDAGGTLALFEEEISPLGSAVAGGCELAAQPGGVALRESLERLVRLGVGELPLDRRVEALAGGERSRLRLAQRLPVDLVGSLVVVDRGLADLDGEDAEPAWRELQRLRDRGNTVLVIEATAEALQRADHVLQLGPGGGPDGGRVVAEAGRTAGRRAKRKRGPRRDVGWLRIHGARRPDGGAVDFEVPKERLTVVVGPSGSGKTALMRGVLLGEVRRRLEGAREPQRCDRLVGASSIGAAGELPRYLPSPRGTETWADRVGVRQAIWRLFGETPRARLKGLFQDRAPASGVPPEYCRRCRGRGRVTVRIPLLPGAEQVCPECAGRRFRDEALGITVRGLTIGDLFEQSASAARDVLAHDAETDARLQLLEELGVGYLELGRPANDTSSGERRTGALACVLSETPSSAALLVLEVPALGMTEEEARRIVGVLRGRVRRGDTVVAIDHHPVLREEADFVARGGTGGEREED